MKATTMQTHYLTCAETAKLLRAALKKSFPLTKFSVRSHVYSGGASITVGWTDGPCDRFVDNVAQQFACGRFDGMIDMAIHVKHWLMPDGSIHLASNPGTAGNRGTIAPERHWMPHPEAKLVSFGATYIHTRRETSPALIARTLARLEWKGYPVELVKVHQTSYGAFVDTAAGAPHREAFDMVRRVNLAVQNTHCARGVQVAEERNNV